MSGILCTEFRVDGKTFDRESEAVDYAKEHLLPIRSRTYWAYGRGRNYAASKWKDYKTFELEEPMSEQANELNEAPAVLWFKYSMNGFECSLTIRGTSGLDLLQKSKAAMAKVQEMGGIPLNGHHGSNGTEERVCPVHQVPMKKFEKDGRSWWSHKAVNPDTNKEYWCRGK